MEVVDANETAADHLQLRQLQSEARLRVSAPFSRADPPPASARLASSARFGLLFVATPGGDYQLLSGTGKNIR